MKPNYYENCLSLINEMQKELMSCLTEINYYKLSVYDKNERNIVNSSILFGKKLSDVSLSYQAMLRKVVDAINEIEMHSDELKVWVLMLHEVNNSILLLSNAITNAAYFINQKSK